MSLQSCIVCGLPIARSDHEGGTWAHLPIPNTRWQPTNHPATPNEPMTNKTSPYRFPSRQAFHDRPAHIRPLITADDFTDKTPRTVLYGYNFDRVTVHVYLGINGELIVMHDDTRIYPAGNQDYTATKRIHPEWLDREFTALLDAADVPISDTTYDTIPNQPLFHPHGHRAPFT